MKRLVCAALLAIACVAPVHSAPAETTPINTAQLDFVLDVLIKRGVEIGNIGLFETAEFKAFDAEKRACMQRVGGVGPMMAGLREGFSRRLQGQQAGLAQLHGFLTQDPFGKEYVRRTGLLSEALLQQKKTGVPVDPALWVEFTPEQKKHMDAFTPTPGGKVMELIQKNTSTELWAAGEQVSKQWQSECGFVPIKGAS